MKTTDEFEKRLVKVVPHPRQLAHQQLEFYAFIHFGLNSFSGREWGSGQDSPAIFNPSALDAGQWVRALAQGGMSALILTCKHHDGFCLWPSRYSDYSVAASPFRNGGADLVAEVARACAAEGLKFGIYLSPWDRNYPSYGTGKPYNDFFLNQLRELLSNYGEIFSVWFDGACGEGKNGKKQHYDWERYYALVRELQPRACISVCGPDVRWCGNEAGDTREEEWSVVPAHLAEAEKVAEQSQQEDNDRFALRKLDSKTKDLGSRTVLQDERELIWYPAEVDVSIRKGWFYHERDDGTVKSADELMRLYERSVGANASLLLNIPPTPQGLLHEKDVKVLKELGERLRSRFAENLAVDARLSSDSGQTEDALRVILEDNYSAFLKPEDGVKNMTLKLDWDEPREFSCVVLKENIALSQRIEKFRLSDEHGRVVFSGSVVGYKKIASFPAVRSRVLKLEILEARVAPTLAFLGVYR